MIPFLHQSGPIYMGFIIMGPYHILLIIKMGLHVYDFRNLEQGFCYMKVDFLIFPPTNPYLNYLHLLPLKKNLLTPHECAQPVATWPRTVCQLAGPSTCLTGPQLIDWCSGHWPSPIYTPIRHHPQLWTSPTEKRESSSGQHLSTVAP